MGEGAARASALVEWSPEEDAALRALEVDLAALLDELASREEEYLTLGQELSTFRIAYVRRFARLFAELDRLEAEIARTLAAREPTADATQQAEATRHRAQESERLADEARSTAEPVPKRPAPADVSDAYRAAAKRLHPDLAEDEADRQRRTVTMARLNAAYGEADLDAIERLVEDEASIGPTVDRGEASRPRGRLERQLQQVRERLAELDGLLAKMHADPMFTLFVVQRQAAAGSDPFAADEADLRARIATARARFHDVAGPTS